MSPAVRAEDALAEGKGKGKSGGSRGRSALRSGRGTTVRVKTARGRRTSSTRWLQRQLNDPYVAAAQRAGYRSRAAFKLEQLDERFGLLKSGQRIVDLGAAPGGWTQVCVGRVGAGGLVVAIDLEAIEAMAGAVALAGDVFDPGLDQVLLEASAGHRYDIVLSDMAPKTIGHRGTDHLRIIALAEAAFELATSVLAPGGSFVAKVWQGGTEDALLAQIKTVFATVRHAKPKASRADSAEVYLVAQGFRG